MSAHFGLPTSPRKPWQPRLDVDPVDFVDVSGANQLRPRRGGAAVLLGGRFHALRFLSPSGGCDDAAVARSRSRASACGGAISLVVAPVKEAGTVVLGVAFFALAFPVSFGVGSARESDVFVCSSVRVTDGDTFRCDGRRVRLYGIDAPELPGHCRKGRACTPGDPYASTDNLAALLQSGPVSCRQVDVDRYGRSVALCSAGRRNLSCAQLAGGFAVRRYGSISCR